MKPIDIAIEYITEFLGDDSSETLTYIKQSNDLYLAIDYIRDLLGSDAEYSETLKYLVKCV